MLAYLVERHRRRRVLAEITVAIRNGDPGRLSGLAQDGHDPLRLAVRAAEATLLLREKDRKVSQAAFNSLYATVKHASDPERSLLRVYCLHYLAVLRGAHADCYFHAANAHKMKQVSKLRSSLCMPRPIERNLLGSFVTATR